ncbi:membrane protein required for colicin V production [Algoriphagus boseongensis]|uniref:Membrane protein required for colicin V production n=1 Tax=Algoriphagus boseongensis TaxID=1442587 RepID=A0A4V3D290_9BACT|nr:CvpA family protein [Algoriphagus boseongensis]TDQ17430.1 membrane protein required for colicin V production [Algoriphagus boseongensis]
MAAVDIVILILIVLGAYEGYKKGLLMGIVGLIGFILAIILGVYFMDPVSKWLAERLDDLTFAFPIIAFLIVFLITLILVNTAGWVLKQVMDMILLGGLDSIAGAILGIVKTGFFISLFIWLSFQFDLKMPREWRKDSEFLQYIEPLAPGVIWVLEPVVPKIKELEKTIEEIVNDFRKEAEKV